MQKTRLIFFCGKGGVGKTVISAAYARELAKKSKVLLTSMTSTDSMEDLFHVQLTEQRVKVMKNLDLLQLDAKKVLDEFIQRRVPMASLIVRHPIYHTVLNVTPGLQEVLTLTTLDIFFHAKSGGTYEYDTLVVDALSTGHMKSLIRSPKKAMEMIPAGGLFDLARDVDQIFHNPRQTQVVIITTLEEMPVTETVELAQFLEEEGIRCDTIIANQVLLPFMGEDAWALFKTIRSNTSLWKEAERSMAAAGYSFDIPQRLLKALAFHEESLSEQKNHLAALNDLLSDKETLTIPLFLQSGKQLLSKVASVF